MIHLYHHERFSLDISIALDWSVRKPFHTAQACSFPAKSMLYKESHMRNRSSFVFLAGLFGASALIGCGSVDTGDVGESIDFDSVNQPQPVADNSAKMVQAETVALTHLHDSARGLMNGVEAVKVMRVRIDERGLAHTRVQQTLGEIPVFGGEAIVHATEKGDFVAITDNFVRDIHVDTRAAIAEFDAIAAATDKVGGLNSLTDKPAIDLQVLRQNDVDHLAYRVQLRKFVDGEKPSMPVIFIDAHTGEELWQYDNLQTASLTDADKTTYDMKRSTVYNNAVVGTDADANLLLTHNSIGTTLAYLQSSVGRDSFNGAGAVVKSYGHYSTNYVNAFWDGSKLTFGDGDNVDASYLGVLDVAAHELGHGVTTYEANLTYSGESGALNEASSDILAAAVEAYNGASSADIWDIGEDCWLSAPALRYMSRPSADGSSRDHYSARYTGTQDNGGVHWNSGIGNHFFYLLAAGGQHHNASYRTGTTVVGIGVDKAYKIWYKALADYMTSSTNFAGARTATLSACSALGYTTECNSVSAAWTEVGVGGGAPPPPPSGSCPTGYTKIDGSLSGTGASQSYTYTQFTGTHRFTLSGPSGTDFDLYLYRNSTLRAASEGATSTESITYSGSANKITVKSYLGGGAYTLCYKFN